MKNENNWNRPLRIIAIGLLVSNSVNALIAGWLFMKDPSGSSLGASINLLEHSPFQNFLIPGIVLFVANGLCSLIAACAALLRWKYYAWLIGFQGGILTGWIIIQVILLQEVNFLHFLFGGIGVLLSALGIVLKSSVAKTQNEPKQKLIYH